MAFNRRNKTGKMIFIFALLTFGALLANFSWSYGPGPNSRNYSVQSQVNITGSTPTILSIQTQSAITLTAGSETTVLCNATIRDYNGYGDLNRVNASLYRTIVDYNSPDDNNTHYTNTSCALINGDGIYANYSCSFNVQYYAVNGTWNCSVQVNDTINLKHRFANSTIINALLALNVTSIVDYGNLSGGEFSNNQSVNISNIGNHNINISVYGYGRNASDGLSFACESGNLTIDLQHFAANDTANYYEKQNLSSVSKQIFGLTVNKTTIPTPVTNTTYWELYVDPAQVAFGQCNGTIVFQAETGQ